MLVSLRKTHCDRNFTYGPSIGSEVASDVAAPRRSTAQSIIHIGGTTDSPFTVQVCTRLEPTRGGGDDSIGRKAVSVHDAWPNEDSPDDEKLSVFSENINRIV